MVCSEYVIDVVYDGMIVKTVRDIDSYSKQWSAALALQLITAQDLNIGF